MNPWQQNSNKIIIYVNKSSFIKWTGMWYLLPVQVSFINHNEPKIFKDALPHAVLQSVDMQAKIDSNWTH
jgi:hypothetical protein